MGLTIRTRRRRMNKQRDHLALIVALEKGSADRLCLRDIQVRLSPIVDGLPVLQLATICKIHGFTPIAEMENGQANWDGIVRRGELTLVPGEQTEHAGYAEIDRRQAYYVEAVVFAHHWSQHWWSRHFLQWRASAVSLPGDYRTT
jgi:hypothetical protein